MLVRRHATTGYGYKATKSGVGQRVRSQEMSGLSGHEISLSRKSRPYATACPSEAGVFDRVEKSRLLTQSRHTPTYPEDCLHHQYQISAYQWANARGRRGMRQFNS
jgi:hypothetical protein